MVHVDAHCDTWTDHFGEPAPWVYEALQEGLLVPHASVQIGIRSAGEHVNDVGGRVFSARELGGLISPVQLHRCCPRSAHV